MVAWNCAIEGLQVKRHCGQPDIGAKKPTRENLWEFLDLTDSPADENMLTGSDVAGRFEFGTEDPQGRKIKTTDALSFKAR